jgi:hypothetical protein
VLDLVNDLVPDLVNELEVEATKNDTEVSRHAA